MLNYLTGVPGWLILAAQILKIVIPVIQGHPVQVDGQDALTTVGALGLIGAKAKNVTGAGKHGPDAARLVTKPE